MDAESEYYDEQDAAEELHREAMEADGAARYAQAVAGTLESYVRGWAVSIPLTDGGADDLPL